MIRIGTEEELLKFINELNQKHKTIKFDFKYSKTKIEFLDVLVYKDINNKLQTTLYKKPTDRQSSCKLGTPEIIKRKHSL